MYILTFDLGSTFFKACLFDSTKLLRVASVKTPVKSPKPDWKEIDPEEFKSSIFALVGELKKYCPKQFAHVLRVCFATQANSFLLLDKHDAPLTPIILWQDLRGQSYVEHVASMYGSEGALYSITGVRQTSAQMIPAKLAWIKDKQADVWNRAHRLCSISDYLTYLFTGEHCSEAGAAGLTSMVDIHNLKWNVQAVETLDLNNIILPKIVRASSKIGKLNKEFASVLGLDKNCEFFMGCLDQYAGAIGAGNTAPGKISETTGTVLATVSMAQSFDAGLASSGVIQGASFAPGKFYRMVAGDVSANLIEKFKNENAPDLSYRQIDTMAADVFGVESGKNSTTSKNAKLGAQLLSIYKRIAGALVEQVEKVRPDKPENIVCVGGAAASDCLLQCKANALGATTIALDCPQPTSLGAAMLAQSDHYKIETAPLTDIRAKFTPH